MIESVNSYENSFRLGIRSLTLSQIMGKGYPLPAYTTVVNDNEYVLWYVPGDNLLYSVKNGTEVMSEVGIESALMNFR